MDISIPGVAGSGLLLLLILVLMGLAALAVWLFRRHRRHEGRTEMADELRSSVQRLGLTSVWQAPLFRSDVYGVRGKINDFDVQAEMWDRMNRGFFRLTVRFPQPMRQRFRLVTGTRRGVEQLMRMERLSTDDERFDQQYSVYCHEDQQEHMRDYLQPQMRRRLIRLGEGVDGLKVGDHSLFLFVDKAIDVASVERLIRDGLAMAVELYDRTAEVGVPTTVQSTTYEMAAGDSGRRNSSDPKELEAFPEGTSAGELEAIAAREKALSGESSAKTTIQDRSVVPGSSTGASEGATGSEGSTDSESSSDEPSESSRD